MNIIQFIKESYLYRLFASYFFKLSVLVNPIHEINRNYFARFKCYPDLKNPKNLIEKIYWLSLHSDISKWSQCADKYRMRDFVEQRGCGAHLPKLFGVWDKAELIDWESLPSSFVLKTNNGCGTVLVVSDKDSINKGKVIRVLKQWLTIPYGYRAYQPHYLCIKPCIIAEELLKQDDTLNALSSSIVDFKLWCFSGKVESCFVAYNRSKTNLNIDLYDSDWRRLTDCIQSNGMDRIDLNKDFPKPLCWEEMKEIASKLSEGFLQVRVDFYVINNRPIIGEMTFTSGYGYFTREYYEYLGSKIDLSSIKKVR